ncbi:MAG: DNA helicase PcrA [Oligoflexia bacterium]|nr:DNA helicase PcrA [Oligoflexia bacterium]
MSSSIDFKSELNPEQWRAVEASDGPVLILAGAGSGKTRVLTYRAAHLVSSGKAHPSELLAVTFTNKAAGEMVERITKLLHRVGAPALTEPLWVSTFHSSCVRILRRHSSLLGFENAFVIYDDSDQLSVIKKVCQDLGINDKIFPPKTFQYQINQAKNKYLKPAQFSQQKSYFMHEKASLVYERYEQEMKRAHALDFGDLLLKTVDLFQAHPLLLEEYQERFKYLMVDEYQDTNHVQYLLIRQLSSRYQNVCVVGDEDQSIYSWRGADIQNILSFERDFPNAQVIKLEQNYRSTKNIVEAASHVIAQNTQRKDKELWTDNPSGDPIVIREEATESDEARVICQQIYELATHENREWQDFAVFYRTNAQSRVIEDNLRMRSIPYRIVGGVRFYDRAEVKDLLAYLKVILNPKDSVGLKRIINTPTRGIGKTTIERLEEFATQRELTLYDALIPAMQERVIEKTALKRVLEFTEMISGLRERAKESPKPREIYHAVLDATQYVQKLKAENTPEADSRVENLEELDSVLQDFERERGEEATLAGFLEEMALVSDADQIENDNAVTLMTLHVSKGLEFPVVFIGGLEENLFPSARSIEEAGDDQCEEERRLFYVGMTRAREKLFLTHARVRRVWGQEQMNPPSRFIAEIPESYVLKTSFSQSQKPKHMWRQSLHAPQSPTRWNPEDEVQTRPDVEDDSFALEISFKKGSRVRHPTFGVGIIHQTEGQGEAQKVTILFGDNSLRKFIVKYARLEALR